MASLISLIGNSIGQLCAVIKPKKSSNNNFDQNVLLCRPHLVTFVSHLLEPRTAIIPVTVAAAASVLRASHSHVSLTQPLGLDSGCHHFALQKAAAARVGGDD